jgi:Spy/CpxP family protein refolding chaperone
MKRAFLTIAMVLFIAFLPALAAAAEPAGTEGARPMGQGRMRMHRAGFGAAAYPGVGMVLRLKEKLELTDEQVTKLQAVGDKVKAGNEAVQAKRTALNEAVKSGAEESVIRAAATELGNAIGDQAVLRVGTKAEIEGILTDDQKTKLEELKQQRPQIREEGQAWRERDPQEAFERIDTDDDGVISLEEFKAHMGQMRERRGDEGTGQPEGRKGFRHRGEPEP